MTALDLGFYIVGAMILAGGVWAVTTKNILHAAMALIASFFATAVLYLMLEAEFVAVAQVLVYIGGVVIFVIFTILLTSRLGEKADVSPGMRKGLAFILSGTVLGLMLHAIDRMQWLPMKAMAADPHFASLEAVGKRFLDPGANGFVVPFEIISVLLLISVIGAIVIARKEDA